ncbi:MAG TPA: molybdopterin-binding protein, partial [Anaerolineae bacterium]|nr:molybdopterin-binding protein [Anaerolineae bacterium]
MSAIARVALLAIGNELLNGEVQDCNLHTLARRLTQQGFRVEQAAMVRDDPPAIAASLRALLATRPDVLLVSGGLGPTADDCTLSAVAAALGRPLLETPAARQAVESAYDRLLAAGYVPQR